MTSSYIKLAIATIIPVIASIIIYLVDEKTPAKKMPYIAKQIIIGVIFGAIAIIGTEWGIPIYEDDGSIVALANCRDAAPICAGLIFGAPAGIIAGLIGGIERFIAVAWGAGEFTRYACTIATIVAGLTAAFLRKKMFENRRPGWILALSIAFVIEIFHLLLVFVLNIDNTLKAAEVVEACTAPMLIANSVAVMLSALFVSLIAGDFAWFERKNIRISQTMQRWLLLLVAIAFCATMFFTIVIQTNVAKAQATELLSQGIEDIVEDIEDETKSSLLALTEDVVENITTNNAGNLAAEYGVDEITIIGEDGTVRNSSNVDTIGENISDYEYGLEFLEILKGVTTEYAGEVVPAWQDPDTEMRYAAVSYNGGFVMVGVTQDHFSKNIYELVKSSAHNRHIGKKGFVVIFDEDFEVVSALNEVEVADATVEKLKEGTEGKLYYVDVEGEEYCVYYNFVDGYYLVSTMPSSEAFYSRDLSMYINGFMEVIVFAAMFVLIFLLVKNVIVKKLQRVNEKLDDITEGNLDTTVDERSNYEFDQLSNGINHTVDALKKYIAEAEARIDAELEFARSIQTSALPSIFPKRDDFDIYACMFTAKEVGGDFYDFYSTHHNILNFLIADVSGKGIPASLFMMRAKTELKSLTETGMSLDEVFTRGNNALCEGNDAGMFVTAFQGCLDTQTGKVLFANAGHNAPAIYRGGGAKADGSEAGAVGEAGTAGHFEYLTCKAGFVLAGMEDIPYKVQELQLQPGDIIFTYTDGVTEATNASDELYGEERLLKVLDRVVAGAGQGGETDAATTGAAGAQVTMQQLCEAVKADVDEFVGDAPQFDDITMLAVRYKG